MIKARTLYPASLFTNATNLVLSAKWDKAKVHIMNFSKPQYSVSSLPECWHQVIVSTSTSYRLHLWILNGMQSVFDDLQIQSSMKIAIFSSIIVATAMNKYTIRLDDFWCFVYILTHLNGSQSTNVMKNHSKMYVTILKLW